MSGREGREQAGREEDKQAGPLEREGQAEKARRRPGCWGGRVRGRTRPDSQGGSAIERLAAEGKGWWRRMLAETRAGDERREDPLLSAGCYCWWVGSAGGVIGRMAVESERAAAASWASKRFGTG